MQECSRSVGGYSLSELEEGGNAIPEANGLAVGGVLYELCDAVNNALCGSI